MANYANLLATIAANIYTNGNREVTAAMVKSAVDAMVGSLGYGYQFRGAAAPSDNPGTPDQRVYYVAKSNGTYTYFGGLSVSEDEIAILKWDSAWSKEVLTINAISTIAPRLAQQDAEIASFEQTIRELIENYPNVTIYGNVTNNPDNEDININENNQLQFADRSTLYGKGYKILRKDKTFAEQVVDSDTIYEIRYDFDLNGASVNIPADTILEFKGGALTNVGGLNLGKNVTINGNGTTIRLSGSIRMNLYCKIFGTTIRRTTQLADNEAIILFDDSLFDRIESNVGCILRDCKILYKIGDGANTHGYAVELVSNGQFIYSGYFGVTFDNVLVNSYCNIGFYIHNESSVVGGTTRNGWITDIVFNRCFVEMAKVGWMLESNSSHSLQEINLVNCSMQCTAWCTYGMDIGFADRIHVVACEFWDWNAVSHNPLNVHDNTGAIYIDTLTPAKESIGYDLNGTYPNKQGKNAIHIEHLYKQSKNLKVVIDLTTSDIKLADWYNIPNGSYVIDQDGALNAKFGLSLDYGGTLFVYGDGYGNGFFKGYIFIGNRDQTNLELRDVAFMSLYSKPNNTDILDASVWFKPTTMTQAPTHEHHYAMKLKGASGRYFHSKPYELARSSSLPSATPSMAGDVYSNSSNSLFAVCDGYEWFYLMTRRASMVGATRPTPRSSEKGMYFFDTGITPPRPIWWTGTEWVDATGASV